MIFHRCLQTTMWLWNIKKENEFSTNTVKPRTGAMSSYDQILNSFLYALSCHIRELFVTYRCAFPHRRLRSIVKCFLARTNRKTSMPGELFTITIFGDMYLMWRLYLISKATSTIVERQAHLSKFALGLASVDSLLPFSGNYAI